MMNTLLFLVLVISLSFAIEYHDPEEEKCSYGDMDYLCENFETCQKFGFIDLNIYNRGCVGGDDGFYSIFTSAPFYRQILTEQQTTEPQVVTNEAFTDDFTTYNGVVTALGGVTAGYTLPWVIAVGHQPMGGDGAPLMGGAPAEEEEEGSEEEGSEEEGSEEEGSPTAHPDDVMLDAPRSTCNVFGDPHFITYDQRPFTYMGTCDNILAMDCYSARWFVYGRMRPCGRGSCLESVTVIVDGMVLELQRGWIVNKNGEKIITKNRRDRVISFTEGETTFNLKFNGKLLELSVVLESPDKAQEKLVIQWDGFMSVQIQTPLTTRTCGLCGDNDGNPDNNFRTRGRQLTADPDVFGASWELGTCNEQAARRTAEEMCGDSFEEVKAECEAIFSIRSFMECKEAGHDATNWVDSCIYDQCAVDLQKEDLPPKCMVAAAYATRCESTFWDVNSSDPKSAPSLEGWEVEAGCPALEERFQPILDTGCPQPTLQEEVDNGSINDY